MITAEKANALATEHNVLIIQKELRSVFYRIRTRAEAGHFNLYIQRKSVDYKKVSSHISFLEDLGYEVVFDSCLQDGSFCKISWGEK